MGRGFLCSGSSITGMREVQMTRDCVHDWQKEYYGWRCSKCEVFVAFGCEPWAFFDEYDDDSDEPTYNDLRYG